MPTYEYHQDILDFLADGGYATIEDWARDSDYHQDPWDKSWGDGDGRRVDLEVEIENAIEASGFLENRG